MEILDIVNENGIPTGETIDRKIAHREGILHRTAHVWILRKRNGRIEILLQKRSEKKETFPGCYDISSAGHIPAGYGFRESAIRELQEELGIKAREEELNFCYDRHLEWNTEFNGEPFHDVQYSRVFFLWRDLDEDAFTFMDQEVEAVKWMDIDACIEAVRENRIKTCIYLPEVLKVKEAAEMTK